MIEKTILAAEYQNFKGRFPKWQQPLEKSLDLVPNDLLGLLFS